MKKILFIIVLYSIQTWALTQELKSYRDLDLQKINQETLVVFDIDNTLLRQSTMIGTHQWGDSFKERAMRAGASVEKAQQAQHHAFAELQPHLQVLPVEGDVYGILNYLKDNKIDHFALTARISELKPVTIDQLKSVGMNFQNSFPNLNSEEGISEYLYQGVIFSGNTPKGDILKSIWSKSIHKYKRIIFIDDRRYNLDSVENSLASLPLDVLTLRYGGADSVVKAFDSKVADIEYSFYKSYKVVLDDATAGKYLMNPRLMAEVRTSYELSYSSPEQISDLYCTSLSSLEFDCSYTDTGYYGDPATFHSFITFKEDSFNKNIYFGDW